MKFKLSEERSYQLAVVIVILGTLVITAVFAVGLLHLLRSDNQTVSSSLDASKFESPLSGDLVVSDDGLFARYFDEIGIPDELELDLREYLLSSDELFKISPEVKKQQASNPSDHFDGSGRWIFIDKSNFTLTLYNRKKVMREWKVAVGNNPGDKQRKGDNRTPNGTFKIRQIQDSSKWTHDFRDGNGVIEGAYGPWFIRLHTPPWTGIGIHGTHDPGSISSRASEGCIRMNNHDVVALKEMVRVGMPVVIVE